MYIPTVKYLMVQSKHVLLVVVVVLHKIHKK